MEQETVDFLLTPNFSMLNFVSATEVLRVANRMVGRDHFVWRALSDSGSAVTASNGYMVPVDGNIADVENARTVLVVTSFEPLKHVTKPLLGWLRRAERKGAIVGGFETASYILATAGLLDGHECCIHWESYESFSERFPRVDASRALFTFANRRMTAAGGASVFDAMLEFVAFKTDRTIASKTASTLIHPWRFRGTDQQLSPITASLEIHHPKLAKTIDLMERNLETPLKLETIASEVGLSSRQLERLFLKYLGVSPKRHYLGLRLEMAQRLLSESDLTVTEISAACGFLTPSHFGKRYRQKFGATPREARRIPVYFGTPQASPKSLEYTAGSA